MKIKAVAESDRLLIKRQLEQRLGLLSYYRSYVPDYAALAKPLTALTGKREPSLLKWGEREQQAFETLRQKVCEAPVLATARPFPSIHRRKCYRSYVPYYAALAKPLTALTGKRESSLLKWGKGNNRPLRLYDRRYVRHLCWPQQDPFLLYTDANAISVGCQLAQRDSTGQEHPVAFASQKLTPTQCAWATIERKAYAVIWSLGRFRDVVFWSHITIFVNHNPLRYLTERAPKSAKLTRWALALQEYDKVRVLKRHI